MMPFFSIITIVRNDLIGLKRTFESVISQNNKDFEWIVVDGASKDGCVKFLESVSFDNFQWISEPDLGIYNAMNKGITLARGSYINFLNAGDFYQKNDILETVRKEIDIYPNQVDLVFGGAYLMMKNKINYYRKPKSMDYVPYGLPSIHQSTYYKTELIKENRYDERYRICGDYYLICKFVSLQPNVLIIDMPLVEFSIGGISYSKPLQLIKESLDIKKNVLKLNLFFRMFVLLKMLVSFLGMYIINNLFRLKE